MAYSKLERKARRLVPEAKGKPFSVAVGALAIRRGMSPDLVRQTGSISAIVAATAPVVDLGRPYTDEELLRAIKESN